MDAHIFEKIKQIDLWVTKKQYTKWETMAKKLNLTLWEYIRRATDAYSNILIQNELE